MGNNAMRLVFSVILAGLSINIVVTELCPHQNNTPAVNFCVESSAEDKNAIFIGNVNSPQYANNHCTCTITPLNFLDRLSVNLKNIHDTANISFVRQDGYGIAISRDSTLTIFIRGVVHVIYQTAESAQIDQICLKLQSSIGTFSVSCARSIWLNDTNTPDSGTTTSTTDTSPSITYTTQGRSIGKDLNPNKGDSAVILGPIIGGICAIIVITMSVIVIVVIIRKRKAVEMKPRHPGGHKKNSADEMQDLPANVAEYTYIDECPSINTDSRNKTAHLNHTKLGMGKLPEKVGAHVMREDSFEYSYADGYNSRINDCDQRSASGRFRKETRKNTFDTVHASCHSETVVCTEHASAYESLTGDRSTDGGYARRLDIPETCYQWVTVEEDAKHIKNEVAPGGTADVVAGDMYLTVVDNY